MVETTTEVSKTETQEAGEESKVPPWIAKEKKRLREKYALEEREAGERMRRNVEERQAARREEMLSIYRLNKANRERPIKDAMERAKLEVEEAGRLAREPKRKNLLSRLNEFLTQPNNEVKSLRQTEAESYEVWKNIVRDTAKRLGSSAGFLRGVRAAFNYLNNTDVSIRPEQRPKTKSTQQPTGARTPATSKLLNR